MRAAAGDSVRWYAWIDAIAIACALPASAPNGSAAASTYTSLRRLSTFVSLFPIAVSEAVRVLADSRNDQAAAVDAFEDRDHVQRQDADPREHEEHAEHTAESERREADDAGHGRVAEDHDQLGRHQHQAVLGMPLHVRVLLFGKERHQREQPQIREHDHHAAIRGRLGTRHLRASVRYSLGYASRATRRAGGAEGRAR